MSVRAEGIRVQAWGSRPARVGFGHFDLQLTLYALLLVACGLLMAFSNSYYDSPSPLQPGSLFTRGLLWLALAALTYLVATAFNYTWIRTFGWPLYAAGLVLLGVSLLAGTGSGGVARWVTVPVIGLQFQFSELAKILVIVALARFLALREEKLDSPLTIIGAGLLVLPPLLLVAIQPDLGSAIVFGAIFVGMLFMAGMRLRWVFLVIGAVVAALPVAWSLLRDYQQARLVSFLDPSADPLGSGWQVLQSQIAVGAGGLFGRGLTNGTQNALGFLPAQPTDFAFAIWAEEFGFVGSLLILGLFTLLLWRILLSGWRSPDRFGLLISAGLASMILFQLLINVGMVVGIMPITGIPLPFISYGGASLITVALGMGILQSVNVRREKARW
ncbi:MAG TPA: rod shape-determining protein RodA [Candidatus Limnocylindrales bacterium]|nr:rod shape-determining protein RodA [Candidatus Limnocylindrales bacterium]